MIMTIMMMNMKIVEYDDDYDNDYDNDCDDDYGYDDNGDDDGDFDYDGDGDDDRVISDYLTMPRVVPLDVQNVRLAFKRKMNVTSSRMVMIVLIFMLMMMTCFISRMIFLHILSIIVVFALVVSGFGKASLILHH